MNIKDQVSSWKGYNQKCGEGRRGTQDFLKKHAMHTSALYNKLNKDGNNF